MAISSDDIRNYISNNVSEVTGFSGELAEQFKSAINGGSDATFSYFSMDSLDMVELEMAVEDHFDVFLSDIISYDWDDGMLQTKIRDLPAILSRAMH
jgi:acyl carrier protein